jgi:hypothetical protein
MNANTKSAATNNAIAQEIEGQIATIDFQIRDAKRRVVAVAEQMLRRAQDAVRDAAELFNDQPCTLSWVNFASGDQRDAAEAKAELDALYAKKKMLLAILRDAE